MLTLDYTCKKINKYIIHFETTYFFPIKQKDAAK